MQLWSDGFYATPKLYWDKATMQGRPFFYYSYGAACSEVVIDTLTGEMRVLRADVLHNVGASLNPALEIGQVEGAFVQGMGWLTTEELWWNDKGKLMTHASSTYKIPTINDMPADFRVNLSKNRNMEDSIHRSKAVRAAAAFAVLGVLLDPRCRFRSRRSQGQSAAERARHGGGNPEVGECGEGRALMMHVVLFGAGHVGHALVKVLGTLPCVMQWVDAPDELFPDKSRRTCRSKPPICPT